MKRLQVRPLAARLLVYVLLFGLLLSLVATGIQMTGEFRHHQKELAEIQDRAAGLVSGSISSHLWLLNYSEVANSLDAMRTLPSIHYAQVSTPDGEVFSTGTYPQGRVIAQTYPLMFSPSGTGQAQLVGEMTIVSSLEQTYEALWSRTLGVLMFVSLLVMLGTLGLLMIVRLTLSRHLEAMADYAARLSLDALLEPLKLNRKPPKRPDELSELERALNKMRLQILEDTRSLRQSTIQSRGERDQAIRANEAKNRFLANVSHELRIPLQSILGYANLLADTPLDQEQQEYIHTLVNASESLSAILNDLLDISSMEAGKLVLEQVPFDLREVINDLIHMLESRAREKSLPLELRIDETLPWALVGDPVRIRQVLVNLVSNAIKFTDSGHVLINVEVLWQREQQVRLRLAVEDTGIGISAEDLPLVYEPYMQLGQHFQRQFSGAGLGLTICRQLVNLMKGTLDVESRPGEGSTFWVELTLPVAPENTARIRPDTRMVRNRRILVVDSYELSRKITLEILSRHQANIEAVRSAGEALTLLRQAFDNQTPYDAVILDGFVPDMDSDLLCRQIRSNPEWDAMRLLILSASPQRGDAEHYRQAGADAFLSKSLRESYLMAILNQLFVDAEHGERHFLTRFSLQTGPATRRRQELPCSRMHVLLVEDNPVNRALTQRLLEKLGCKVMTATDGGAAEALWRWHSFDLVIMDCVMPTVDGLEATRRFRQWEKEQGLPRVPVVALTASAMEKDEEQCRLAGMDSFVAKPVTIEMLRAVLEQYCHAPAATS